MKKTKNAIVLIYVLFLVTLAVVFATILLNNNAFLFSITNYFENDSKLYTNIDSDAKIMIEIDRDVNSNWSWFIDNISCPSWNTVNMSWTTLTENIKIDILTYDWDYYCEWSYQSQAVKIYFNSGFTDFDEATYWANIVSMSSWIWNNVFWDSDSTLIDISWSAYFNPDWIDDDFNSDDYLVTSAWVYYPNDFQDDDNSARKLLFWYVPVDYWYKKVFWNTKKTLKIIDENTNNNDTLNEKIWNVNAWYLYFDVDADFDIKLLKFNKSIYNESNELIRLETLTWALNAWIWYLQWNWWVLSLSATKTWNEYEFDFVNDDYAIFIKRIWAGTLLYKITWETTTWTWIYITPIDDSDNNIIKYLWNEILIDEQWRFLSKEVELIFTK